MDINNKNRNKYDRVMSRVYNCPRVNVQQPSKGTRREIPSVRVGAKSSISNVSSSVFTELPVVLNDYNPESCHDKVIRKSVVKPRKTVKSLDPELSPHKSPQKHDDLRRKPCNIKLRSSTPSVLFQETEKWSDTHVRQCLTSRSHSKIKDLKDEIKAYQNTEKLLKLRSHLYKTCGVVLDNVGRVATDKAVQVEEIRTDEKQSAISDQFELNSLKKNKFGTKFIDFQLDKESCG